MGGYFGVVSKNDCVTDLFYGTDYHSHLGTHRGGLAVYDNRSFTRYIHDITNAQFRSKFEYDVLKLKGRMGIGAISDTDDQPLLIGSHLGAYAIVTVGRIANLPQLVRQAYALRSAHFSEMSSGAIPWRWTWWLAFLIPAPATPSVTRTRKRCRSAARSSNTPPPGPAASCPRSSPPAIWWRA